MLAENDWDQFVIIDSDTNRKSHVKVVSSKPNSNRLAYNNVYDPDKSSFDLYGILFGYPNVSMVKRLFCGAMYCVINLVSRCYLFDAIE